MYTYLTMLKSVASIVDVTVDCELTDGNLSMDIHVDIEIPEEVSTMYRKLVSDDD